MTPEEFASEMGRLASVYPGNPYPRERMNLIWREVNRISKETFKRVVDQLIGKHSRAPMLPEITEVLCIERERAWQQEKSIERREAKQAWSRLSQTEIGAILGTIVKRVEGEVPDQEWDSFNRSLDTLASQAG